MFAGKAIANRARERSGDQSNRFPADVVLALTAAELLVFKAATATRASRWPGSAGPTWRSSQARSCYPSPSGVADGIVQFRALKKVGGDDLYAQLTQA
jgi:hypothetical protein